MPTADSAAHGDLSPSPELAYLTDPNVWFPAHPRFVDDLSVVAMPDGLGVQVRGLAEPLILRGRFADVAIEYLLVALDGTRGLSQLVAERPATLPPHALLRTLVLLHGRGALAEAESHPVEPPDDEGLRRQLLFWGRNLGITRANENAAAVRRRLETAHVVAVVGGIAGMTTLDLLGRCGIGTVVGVAWDEDPAMLEAVAALRGDLRVIDAAMSRPADLVRATRPEFDGADLVLTATRNASALLDAEINRACLDLRVRFLRAGVIENAVELGPLVLPYESGCIACMRARAMSAHPTPVEEDAYQRWRGDQGESAVGVPPVGEPLYAGAIAAGLIVGEVMRVLTAVSMPTVINAVSTYSLASGEMRTNRFLRVPRCPECQVRAVVPGTDGGC
jgi:bacteriocin biosynthesis cyclodehydratase domain-containing protein